nr:ARMT1-like domain-containing protein [Candidatus Njordarchaeota archaeon]
MKVKPVCAACLLHRGIREIELATSNPEVRMRTIKKLLRFLSQNFSEYAVSATLGTNRDRIIRHETGCSDPYKEKKILSNNLALGLLPKLRNTLENEREAYKRFRKACLAAIVGNSIEFDILEHDQELEDFPQLFVRAEEQLEIDQIQEIYSKVKNSKKILYLADNAGEIVIDSLFVEEIRKVGPSVVVAVKSGPVLNDATMNDALIAKIPEVADKVITTGTDSVGLILSESSEELKGQFSESDLVISKGMGSYETINEERIADGKCIAFLLRAKCSAVADDLGVKKGSNVAKLSCWK